MNNRFTLFTCNYYIYIFWSTFSGSMKLGLSLIANLPILYCHPVMTSFSDLIYSPWETKKILNQLKNNLKRSICIVWWCNTYHFTDISIFKNLIQKTDWKTKSVNGYEIGITTMIEAKMLRKQCLASGL